MFRSQSFSEIVPLGSDLHKCFSVFSPLGKIGKLEGFGVGFLHLGGWLVSGKIPAGSGKIISLEERPC